MRSEEDVKKAIYTYSDSIKRICILYLKSPQDTEDIMQNVFLKYAMHDKPFEIEEHRKAWLMKVAVECLQGSFEKLLSQKDSFDGCNS